ncbi:hypothetical protein WDW86_02150 [Bdellovibrionota bacterium FG-2]
MTDLRFFEKVKKLVSRINIRIDLSRFINIQVNNIHIAKNDTDAIYDVKGTTARINVQKLTQIELKEFQHLINSAIDDSIPVIEEQSHNLVEDFLEKEKNSGTQHILQTLNGIITPEDYQALRMSLYVKQVFAEGKNISRLKNDISFKYGDRGNKICNLCSAGYFETFIIPLYNEMKSRSGFDSAAFLKIYDVIVNQTAFSVFVSRNMSLGEIATAVKNKIAVNEKYGIHYFNIHGIGKSNVNNIRAVFTNLEVERNLTKTINEKDDVISVRCEFIPLAHGSQTLTEKSSSSTTPSKE